MKRFIEGEDRGQGTLLPELLDDYVTEDNLVRVVDVFVDELDLTRLASRGCNQQRRAGRPARPLASRQGRNQLAVDFNVLKGKPKKRNGPQ